MHIERQADHGRLTDSPRFIPIIMQILNTAAKHTVLFWLVTRPRANVWRATIILKAAYRLIPTDTAVPDETAPPIASGDDPAEPDTSLRYGSDFVPYKPNVDFLVVGAAHPSEGRPVKACRVSIGIGRYTKSLAVFGDRRWTWGPLGASPGEAEAFVTLQLGYDRAYGGPGFSGNPVGRGIDVKPGQPMPNIECLDHLVVQSTHRPQPAGFGPLRMLWQPRISKAGSYDAAWLAERWPWFPADLDWSFFNAAPPDQQFATLRGDETLQFENMHPDHGIYRSQLPGVAARAFVERTADNAGIFEEVPLKLDTVWVDVPAERLVQVWRGTTRVRSSRLRDIAAICATLESLDSHGDIDSYRKTFATLKNANPAAEAAAARRVEADKLRRAALARLADVDTLVAKARAQIAGVGKMVDAASRLTELETRRRQANSSAEDPAKVLQNAIASLKTQDPAKGAELEDRLAAFDAKLGEILGRAAWQAGWTRERVIETLAKGESLAMARLDGLNLAGLDFTGADLHGATLRGTTLQDALLERANLAGADLSQSDLTNTSFIAADLRRANLSNAVVGAVTFVQARIDATNFAKLSLARANFAEAAGEAPDFTEAVLDEAQFTNATLARSQFSDARAARTDFSNAVLEAANFAGAQAPGIIMEGADLTNLRASRGADFTEGKFARARASRSVWQQAILDRADFDRAVLSRAQFPESSLCEAHFDRAHLQNANFDDAVLVGARFTNANLLRASFERADLTQARVDGCNLYGAGFLDATLENTTFQGSMIVQTLLVR
jgi:uncharacterized protein YjbI with pentapeptide repeats